MSVLIVGAGASGLTLAIELARRNVAFRLIEKLNAPFRGSRGKGIQPRSQEVFEDMGILNRVVAAGGTYPPMREYNEDGSFKESVVMEMQPATAAEPYCVPLLVPQFLTEAAMRERLAELGICPEYNCELTSFQQDNDGVTACLSVKDDTGAPAREESVRVRYLVGADGGRSVVRHALGVNFPGKTLGVRAIVADVRLKPDFSVTFDAWHRWNEGDMSSMISTPGAHSIGGQ